MSSNSVPLQWGDYSTGTDDDGTETMQDILGSCYELHDVQMTGLGGGSPKRRATDHPTKVLVLRNGTGAALLPGELAKLEHTTAPTSPGGASPIPLLTEVSAKTSALDRLVVVVDPYLPSAGVPDKGIFLGVICGPTKAKLPAAAGWTNGDITVGDPLIALGSGRIGKYDSTPTGTPPADAEAAQITAISLIGTSLETKAETGNESTLLRVYFKSPMFT